MTKKETEKVEERNIKNPEVTNPEVIPPPVEKIEEKEEKVPKVEDLQKEIKTLNRKVVNKTEEAKRVHDKLDAFEKADKERELEDLSEIDKLKAELDEKSTALLETQTSLKEKTLNEQKMKVAADAELPPILALRIRGETPEEMEEDARALKEGLKKRPLQISVTNPGNNATPIQKSVKERLCLLYTSPSPRDRQRSRMPSSA